MAYNAWISFTRMIVSNHNKATSRLLAHILPLVFAKQLLLQTCFNVQGKWINHKNNRPMEHKQNKFVCKSFISNTKALSSFPQQGPMSNNIMRKVLGNIQIFASIWWLTEIFFIASYLIVNKDIYRSKSSCWIFICPKRQNRISSSVMF